ncbi:hypothetical protein HYH02_010311 [Chlamydomonas schloesseri]|uniref:Protein kinase domain-containing protein n=1 Tax=Chlamydomonas schloesseri TaxID=2026947 RepID=A0A835T7U5_9CHLO|nr:hypothetical protein HYH02_010311 [Chlamydomonas schloesseri]|eukprot:KAG2440424.1 hypothetical protein HYH02_010311 [Chlamydomonas schloesseri]
MPRPATTGMVYVVLALAFVLSGRWVDARTVTVSSGAGLAAAIASPDVDVALITTDITLSDQDWDNYTLPIELNRNFTALGRAGAQGLLPVVDLAAVKQKVRLHVGYTLTFKNMVLWHWRDGSSNQAPGLSLLTPTVTPPGMNGTIAIARLEDVDMLYRYCFPKWLGVRAATLFVRPPEMPGNNSLQWDFVWPNNCTLDSPWAHPQLRCYAYVGRYIDLATRGLDADSSGKTTFPNGYMVQYLNAVALCTDVMPDDCLAKLSPVGCSLFLNSQPEAPLPPRPAPLPPAPGSTDPLSSGGGGTDTGTIVGAVVGGVIGGLLLMALLAWLLATARRRQHADKAAAAAVDGKGGHGTAAGAAGSSSRPNSSSTGLVIVDMGSASNCKEMGPAVRTGTMASSSSGGDFMGGGGGGGPISGELSSVTAAASAKVKAGVSPKWAAGGSPHHPRTMEETPVVTQQTPARADIKLDVRVGVPPLGATGGLASERAPPPAAGTASSGDIISDSTGMSSIPPITASMDAALAAEERAQAAAAAAAAAGVAGSSAAAAAASAAAVAAAAEGAPKRSGVVQSEVRLTAVTLGTGGFGRVLEGEWQGRRVAVKMVADTHTFGGSPEVLLKCFKQEVEILARVQHANIVQLLAACTTPPRLCLIMELMETSLEMVLHGPKPMRLPLRKVLYIAAEVAKGLEALHPTVIHRDLKPANVLINNAAGPKPVVKITDFGLSRLRNTTVVTATPGAGTPAYLAPECYEAPDGSTGAITYQADMYSLGVLLYEMLAHTRPWAGQLPVHIAVEVAVQGKRLPLDKLAPTRCPPQLRELVTQMWDADPLRRPAAAEVAKALDMMIEAMDAVQDDGHPGSPAAAGGFNDSANNDSGDGAGAGGSGRPQDQQPGEVAAAARQEDPEDYDFGPILAVSLASEGAWRR